MYKFNLVDYSYEELATIGTSRNYGLAYYDNKIYHLVDDGQQEVRYVDLTDNSVVELNQFTHDDFQGISSNSDGYLYSIKNDNKLYRYYPDGSGYEASPIVLSETYVFWRNHSIVNTGWLMAPDGTEVNIADLFAGTLNARKNYDLISACGQVAILNGDIWRGKIYGHRPYAREGSSFIFDGVTTEMSGTCITASTNPSHIGINPIIQTLGTCLVLDTPVVKSDIQTMKITYTLTVDVD